MPAFVFSIPLLPGKEQTDKEYMREAVGPRRQEYAAWHQRLGITRQAIWHQQTPQGTVAIVYMEADDPQRAMQDTGSSTEPIAQWFRQCMLEVHGLDLTQPMPGPPPELVIDERF